MGSKPSNFLKRTMSDTPNILIIDDDPVIRNLLKKNLSVWDCDIHLGTSGQEAIDFVTKNSVDLVLLDIGLPDMEGYQVLKHIRRKTPDTLVIMVTGDVSVDSAVNSLRSGAYDYLKKPFTQLELLKTIKNALDHKKAQKEHKETEEALQESEEKFRTLVSNIPGAVYRCALDADWTMYFISDAIEEICGYPASNFIENSVRTYTSVIHPDDREMVEKTVYENTDQRKPFIIGYRVFHTDGTIRWVYEKGQAVFGDDGKVLWLDGAIFDITKTKQLEHQLIIRNKMLSLGRVAAGIAHEIRNPLTGINSYLYTD
jgi:PAS domain S-box-containing protein